ncbi:hypothetical protein LOK49_LG15G00966 [Camellia lanceoleosa]|uniref:Uncharacterized protein n=1 Tax=Camellia lanceoleosa TaxID=1840588 RepID=A0ACC0F796_9ERIC|nr:hypothetical protein LOK49_LG15G00966 [Camellia lanceoleosa]
MPHFLIWKNAEQHPPSSYNTKLNVEQQTLRVLASNWAGSLSTFLFEIEDDVLSGLARKQNYLARASFGSVYRLSYNAEICRNTHPFYMISRALSADAAKVTSEEVSRASPLVEYECRITAGELVDGDSCQDILTEILQVGTLRKLQRLHDELVDSAHTSWLDRYSASKKGSK